MYSVTATSHEEVESVMLDVFETCCKTANVSGIESLTIDELALIECQMIFEEFYYKHI